MAKIHFLFRGETALLCGVVVLVSLTGCVGDMPHRGAWSIAPETRQVPTTATSRDEYLYFPSYAIYYNSTQLRYVCLESDGWATRIAPRDVTVGSLLASPSVLMDFHDSPVQHHDSVVRRYPKNWPIRGLAFVDGLGS